MRIGRSNYLLRILIKIKQGSDLGKHQSIEEPFDRESPLIHPNTSDL